MARLRHLCRAYRLSIDQRDIHNITTDPFTVRPTNSTKPVNGPESHILQCYRLSYPLREINHPSKGMAVTESGPQLLLLILIRCRPPKSLSQKGSLLHRENNAGWISLVFGPIPQAAPMASPKTSQRALLIRLHIAISVDRERPYPQSLLNVTQQVPISLHQQPLLPSTPRQSARPSLFNPVSKGHFDCSLLNRSIIWNQMLVRRILHMTPVDYIAHHTLQSRNLLGSAL